MQQQSEPTLQLEVRALKRDKERLVQLLQSTTEFQDFSGFAKDSGGGLRFLPPKPRTRRAISFTGERENWIPAEAFELAFDVRDQTNGEISPQLIHHLLVSLNKIWRSREKKGLA